MLPYALQGKGKPFVVSVQRYRHDKRQRVQEEGQGGTGAYLHFLSLKAGAYRRIPLNVRGRY